MSRRALLAVCVYAGVTLATGHLGQAQVRDPAPQSPDLPGIVRVTIEVELSCPFCAAGLERRLRRLDYVSGVEVSPSDGRIVLVVEPGRHPDPAVVWDTVRNAGFITRPHDGHRHRARHRQERHAGPRPVARLRPPARRDGRPHGHGDRGRRPTGEGDRTLERVTGRRRTAAGRVRPGLSGCAGNGAPLRHSRRGPIPARVVRRCSLGCVSGRCCLQLAGWIRTCI